MHHNVYVKSYLPRIIFQSNEQTKHSAGLAMASPPPPPPNFFNETASMGQREDSVSVGSTVAVHASVPAGHSHDYAPLSDSPRSNVNGNVNGNVNDIDNGHTPRNDTTSTSVTTLTSNGQECQMVPDRDIGSANGRGGKGYQYFKDMVKIMKPFYVSMKTLEKKQVVVDELYRQLVIIDQRSIFKYRNNKYIKLAEKDAKEKIKQAFRDCKKFENNVTLEDEEDIIKEGMQELRRFVDEQNFHELHDLYELRDCLNSILEEPIGGSQPTVENNSSIPGNTSIGREGQKRKRSSSRENNNGKRLRRSLAVYIYPEKIDRNITADVIDFLGEYSFPEIDQIRSSTATKWFDGEIMKKSYTYLEANENKRHDIVIEIFEHFQSQHYEMVYLLEKQGKVAVQVPLEKEIKRAIRLSLEASQKKPPATGSDNDNDNGGGRNKGDGCGPSGDYDGTNSRKYDNYQDQDKDRNDSGDNNRDNGRGSGGGTSGSNRGYQASIKYGERDIVLDDPTHPGTIFFNSLIGNLKDLYATASAENKENIAPLVAEHYDKCKEKYAQGGELLLSKESDDSILIQHKSSQLLALDRSDNEMSHSGMSIPAHPSLKEPSPNTISHSQEAPTDTSIEYGDRDIVLDDPTHPGTVFFNGLIGNLKDMYANTIVENKKSIAHLVAERYDEWTKRNAQEKLNNSNEIQQKIVKQSLLSSGNTQEEIQEAANDSTSNTTFLKSNSKDLLEPTGQYIQHSYTDRSPPPSKNKNRKPGLTAKGDQIQYFRHSYTDRSSDIIRNLTTSDKNALRLYRKDSVGGPFPLKLQIVLKVTEKVGQQHIISWLPHGRSFMIHRPREFEEQVMGNFFKLTKLTSFRRQLNLYDFQRITHGRDAGSYYHELFLRGRPLLANRMLRRKLKGTKIRASSSLDDEPNFYTMTFMGPITDFVAAAASSQMDNLNYSSALAASALHRNNFASSLVMSNERHAAIATYNAATNPALSMAAFFDSMAMGGAGVGVGGGTVPGGAGDPRITNFNESLLGASSHLGGGGVGGGGNYPGSALSSMLPNHSSLAGAAAAGLVNNENLLRGAAAAAGGGGLNINSASAAANVLDRQSLLMQEQDVVCGAAPTFSNRITEDSKSDDEDLSFQVSTAPKETGDTDN